MKKNGLQRNKCQRLARMEVALGVTCRIFANPSPTLDHTGAIGDDFY